MGKYFGTDGVRGVANQDLTPELAFKIGKSGAYFLSQQQKDAKMVIGRDTRISGEMLESALIAGILSVGVDVIRLGIIPTPAVAYMTRKLHANGGIMISASHNPFQDNGIKFFGSDGFKLLDEIEEKIEAFLDLDQSIPLAVSEKIGKVSDYKDAGKQYISFLSSTIPHSLKRLNIVMDGANGAASFIAKHLFEELGANVTAIHTDPNGININVNCGSTHPSSLQKMVIERNADVGFAFDGDADRLIAVDENGEITDGDDILYICGNYLKEKNLLKKNTIVSTVMCNFGFKKALEHQQIICNQTSVGDRYVMEEMTKNGYNLGGEQSGHVIFLDHNTTGDGLLTAVQLANVLIEKRQSLSSLKKGFTKFPQLLLNVRVSNKEAWVNNPSVKEAMASGEEILGDNGRILVRPSGTESLIRVMAEGPNLDMIDSIVKNIAQKIKDVSL